jgi:hypothetical protein
MEIKSAINDVNGTVKLYWQDLLRKERIVSNSAQDGRMGAPLSPQEWIEHYYMIEGAIDYLEDTEIDNRRKVIKAPKEEKYNFFRLI